MFFFPLILRLWEIMNRTGRSVCLIIASRTNSDGRVASVGETLRKFCFFSFSFFCIICCDVETILLLLTVKQVRKDEKKYYQELIQYSRQNLMVNFFCVAYLNLNITFYQMIKVYNNRDKMSEIFIL